jgi:hypothetical protein
LLCHCHTNMSVAVRYCYLENFYVLFAVWCFFETVRLLSISVTAQQTAGVIQTTTTLSEARYRLAATSSGELVFFGGGVTTANTAIDRIDIYNVIGGIWTTATLSIPRYGLAAVSTGNLVFFAGGCCTYNRVDIYNISTGIWEIATLSQARQDLAATSVGNLVLFGGGIDMQTAYNTVDIYNVKSNTWTTATLSQARGYLAATSVANRYALFAGGYDGTKNIFDTVDIYDSVSGMWNTTTLSQARQNLGATSLGSLAFFGGGEMSGGQATNIIDIFNSSSKEWSIATLSQARHQLAATSLNDIVAFGGGYSSSGPSAVVDLYSVANNQWFTKNLIQPRSWLAATSSTNKIFFGGGQIDFSSFSNAVDVFNLATPSTLTAGILVAVMLIIIAIVLLIVLLRRKRMNKKLKSERNNEEVQKKEAIVLETTKNTVTLNETNLTAMTTYQPGTETLKGLAPGHIPLNELDIGKEIGNGNYGRVCIGKWKKSPVALKFCQNKGKMEEFMREAHLMSSVPPHPNVVRMYGVSIDGTQPIIVMEYCTGGSLDKLLFDTAQQISHEQKIRWVHEIALGMCHLHKHNIVHRDLAARNILLSQPNPNDAQLKISDFGMSRVLEQDIESRTRSTFGPIRWMAPESLGQQVYSKKSDVWMFGILVYEIVARREPHVDIQPNEIIVFVRDKGLTPTIPTNCPPKLRELMQMCWKMQPEQRPNFETICALLEQ